VFGSFHRNTHWDLAGRPWNHSDVEHASIWKRFGHPELGRFCSYGVASSKTNKSEHAMALLTKTIVSLNEEAPVARGFDCPRDPNFELKARSLDQTL
jgi:hypothetical protein